MRGGQVNGNVYQPLFDKLDKTVVALDDIELAHASDKDTVSDASDLLKRLGFVVANMLNTQVHLYSQLIIEPDTPTEPAEDTDGDPVEGSE